MAIRELINEHKKISLIVVAVLLLGGLLAISMQLGVLHGGSATTGMVFFSNDDGKTWFADSVDKLPPFDHEGKPAYQAFVWTCDDGKTEFVSHLMRYTEAGKRAMGAEAAAGPAAPPGGVSAFFSATEIKRPGDTNWIPSTHPRAGEITIPSCPNGEQPQMVSP